MLDPNTVHVWVCDLTPYFDRREALQLAIYPFLKEAEIARVERFRRSADQVRSLISVGMKRLIVSKYLALAPGALQFSKNAQGKPCLDMPGCDAPVYFNVSHSHHLCVLAVSDTPELGVDVEHIDGQDDKLKIAENYFTRPEFDALARLERHDRIQQFYALWTLKEAYIKARGLGLSLSLDKFAYAFDEHHGLRLTQTDNGSACEDWGVALFQHTNLHNLSVCVHKNKRYSEFPIVLGYVKDFDVMLGVEREHVCAPLTLLAGQNIVVNDKMTNS